MVDFIKNGGIIMIPINVMGLAIVALIVERVYSLFIKKDGSPENLVRRLPSFRFLCGACIITGVIGTLMGYYQAFSAADKILARPGAVFPIYEVSRIALSTTIWGLVMSLLALVGIYVVKLKAGDVPLKRSNPV